ncbi:BsuPI-related putative proteinase inhibitor [Alteribacillus sp. JSM 102045]|uniref:BsuPI-related putative proteinase inhibitor n=1 Tax=Alteribacillus sp. JSM 102045 TaxID=1562101 RepID=UPI0035BF6351
MKCKAFIAGILFLLLITACGTSETDETGGEEEQTMEKDWKLTGEFDVDTNSWSMKLENLTESPLELNFKSGQEVEVKIKKEDQSETVYTYSADKMFTQALKETTIDPGSSKSWSEDISKETLEKGTYTIEFEVLAYEINGKKPEEPIKTTETFEMK